MKVKHLIKQLKEEGNQKVLDNLNDYFIDKMHSASSCGEEALYEMYIKLIQHQPTALQLIALEIGCLIKDAKGLLICNTAVEGVYEAYYNNETPEDMEFIEFVNVVNRGKSDIYTVDRAEAIKNVYPQFFGADTNIDIPIEEEAQESYGY